MTNAGKVVLSAGLALMTVGLIYLIIMALFFEYRLGPMDMISVGMGFVGFAMAWPVYKESQRG